MKTNQQTLSAESLIGPVALRPNSPVQRGTQTSAKAPRITNPASCAAHFHLLLLKSLPAHKSTTKKFMKAQDQFMSGLLHQLAQSHCLAFSASSKNP